MDAAVVTAALSFVLLYPSVHCSMKKGLGVSPTLYKCDDLAAFTNMYWWYDWGANFDVIEKHSKCDLSSHSDTYVPMIWGYRSSWPARVREIDKTNNKFLLGFNEPNHQHQSDLTPAEAAAAWHLVEEAANGAKIVGPAAAECGADCNGQTIEWFDAFFDILCENETSSPCRMDYLATHVYSCSATQTMNFLQTLYQKYNLKIWLTEFACPNSDYPEEQLYEYMQPLLDMLEDADFIYKYAWYMARSNDTHGRFVTRAVSLLDQTTSVLTELGQYYNNFYRPFTTTTEKATSITTSSSTSSTTSTTSVQSTSTSASTSTTSASSTTTTTSTSSTTTTVRPSTTTYAGTTVDSGTVTYYSMYNNVVFTLVYVCISYFILF
ncbi:uncharacterized protein LOC132748429 [Ruditapes philippinarum]|uniref:uncharacterized protein LOC132748429 n=1 Tax=Ruditapes philippinarum TaxID=129788 RepID=UPI00295A7261|nr:uncharacterized protein LOC132748429 [Ruditapes philippinarum]XP_060594024.1 uncharacterized protein LOC132748429 [Ruditapes philippinarum]XP_060594025.1 uncharacterized protein LOC132748429 [Ruditapes philippinarum]